MKKFVIAVFVLFISFACMVQPSSAIVLSAIEGESPAVWGISINDKYVPQRGGIKVCKAENDVIVGFYLSDDNINFYKQAFSDGRRKPMGFEMDIIDYSGVFNRNDLVSVTAHGFSSSLIYLDNYQLDDGNNYTLAINNPSVLEANKWYTVTFHFSKHVDVNVARYEIQVQLVGDVYALKNNFSDIYSNYSFTVKSEFAAWFAVMSNSDGNNFFNIRSPRGSLFSRDKFFAWPEGTDSGYDRFLWHMTKGQVGDYKPYSCSFGSDPWDNFNNNGLSGPDLEGDYGTTGPGTETVATEQSIPQKPDFIIEELWLEKGNTSIETYNYSTTDTIKIRTLINNIGSFEADSDIETRWFLSEGYKMDKSSEWKHIETAQTRHEDLKPGETHSESETYVLSDHNVEPGIWNIVACADRTRDEGNEGGDILEEHENNNCSTEAVFTVYAAPLVPPSLSRAKKAAVMSIINNVIFR